jgi:hypothetical protein
MPGRKTRLGVFDSLILVTCGALLVSAAALGQGIHKWQTPDGKLYFGDKPPAGSKDLGVMESAPDRGLDDGGRGWESSTERGLDGGSCDKDNMSVSASNRRGAIEKQICARVDRLKRIDEARSKVLSSSGDASAAKIEALRLFQETEREERENIDKLRAQFAALGAIVRKCFGGTPDWWRDKLSCP